MGLKGDTEELEAQAMGTFEDLGHLMIGDLSPGCCGGSAATQPSLRSLAQRSEGRGAASYEWR